MNFYAQEKNCFVYNIRISFIFLVFSSELKNTNKNVDTDPFYGEDSKKM